MHIYVYGVFVKASRKHGGEKTMDSSYPFGVSLEGRNCSFLFCSHEYSLDFTAYVLFTAF